MLDLNMRLVAKEEEAQKCAVDLKDAFAIALRGRLLLSLDSLLRRMMARALLGGVKQWQANAKAGLALSIVEERLHFLTDAAMYKAKHSDEIRVEEVYKMKSLVATLSLRMLSGVVSNFMWEVARSSVSAWRMRCILETPKSEGDSADMRLRLSAMETKQKLQKEDWARATKHTALKMGGRMMIFAHHHRKQLQTRNILSRWRVSSRDGLPWHRILNELAVPGAPLAALEAERLSKLVVFERESKIKVESRLELAERQLMVSQSQLEGILLERELKQMEERKAVGGEEEGKQPKEGATGKTESMRSVYKSKTAGVRLLKRIVSRMELSSALSAFLCLYRSMHSSVKGSNESIILMLNREIMKQERQSTLELDVTRGRDGLLERDELIAYQQGELSTMRLERDMMVEKKTAEAFKNSRFASALGYKMKTPRGPTRFVGSLGDVPVNTPSPSPAAATAIAAVAVEGSESLEKISKKVSGLHGRLGRIFEMAGVDPLTPGGTIN